MQIPEDCTVLVSDYSATGEGLTVCILVTNHGSEEKLKEKFVELFGDFFSIGMEVVTGTDRERYYRFIPEIIFNGRNLCGLTWHGQFHINCS